MTTTSKPFIGSGYVSNSESTGYQAGSTLRSATIDKYTAYNSDSVSRTLTVKIVANGGSASADEILVVKTLQPGETYTFPELVGHTLEPGGFISEIASAGSVIVRRCSGREVT